MSLSDPSSGRANTLTYTLSCCLTDNGLHTPEALAHLPPSSPPHTHQGSLQGSGVPDKKLQALGGVGDQVKTAEKLQPEALQQAPRDQGMGHRGMCVVGFQAPRGSHRRRRLRKVFPGRLHLPSLWSQAASLGAEIP